MGAIGGAIFHSISGYRNAPKGARLANTFQNVRIRAPITGGQFAAWGGMFSAIDCCLVYARKKEDPLNSIASGALTGAALTIRSGRSTMLASAVIGGVLLAMIEGFSIIMTRMSAPSFDITQQMPPPEEPRNIPSKPAGSAFEFGTAQPMEMTG